MSAPGVSVVLPVRDGELYLEEAVESVLGQGHPDLELIVVDDGSTDGTPAVLARIGDRIRAVRQPPSGGPAALNRGIALATGTFLAFIDADDLWVPGKLALQLAAFEREPELDFVQGHAQQFHSPELTDAERAKIACPPEPMPGGSRGSLLIRRESHLRVGASDTSLRLGEFIDWNARATELGLRGAMLPDVVLRRRLHPHNSTLRGARHRVDYVRVARAALHRRRSAG